MDLDVRLCMYHLKLLKQAFHQRGRMYIKLQFWFFRNSTGRCYIRVRGQRWGLTTCQPASPWHELRKRWCEVIQDRVHELSLKYRVRAIRMQDVHKITWTPHIGAHHFLFSIGIAEIIATWRTYSPPPAKNGCRGPNDKYCLKEIKQVHRNEMG